MDSENYFSNNGRIGKKNERFIDEEDEDEKGIQTVMFKLFIILIFAESSEKSTDFDALFLGSQKDFLRNKREKSTSLTKNREKPAANERGNRIVKFVFNVH